MDENKESEDEYHEIVDEIAFYIEKHDLSDDEVKALLFSLLCTFAGYTQGGDEFMIDMKIYIDKALNCALFDQIMTEFSSKDL